MIHTKCQTVFDRKTYSAQSKNISLCQMPGTRPRSACANAQADLGLVPGIFARADFGLRCRRIKSVDTVEYIDEQTS